MVQWGVFLAVVAPATARNFFGLGMPLEAAALDGGQTGLMFAGAIALLLAWWGK